MRKGILFSMDAMLALIVVIIFIAWAPHQIKAMEEQGSAFENLHDQALDKAIIGYYEGSSGTVLTGTEDVYKCIPAYNLNQNNNLGVRADPVPENFCEAR